ncbi:hypothetical protein C1H46_007942 [Malus baccata]|uniref:Pentacotripeptide-repeat region of PRORP domain-containing protein n=1 Tax=Malus baccata TaxID=106549 RepID=A0A540N7C6_MALBA|nr:hypothetical protein C1H46_007942 [Malus baccata]
MFIKLHPLTFSKRIPTWVCLNAYFSASSCAKRIEIFSGNNQDPEYSSDVEQNIQSLGNKLVPDNLIRVLDNTDDLSSAVKVFKWASLQKRFNHTADTYFRIVLKLGLAGNVEEMEGFCQNMVKDRCPGAEEALLALIDVFVSHCRLSEAIRVLVNLKAGGFRPSIEIFNGLLGALVKDKRDFRDVLFVYKEIVTAGIVPTVDTLNYLLEALVEANRIESALDQYRRMKKKRCSPNSRSFEILLKALIAKDRVDEAVIVLNEMVDLGYQPDLSFYSFIIPLFCQENKPDEGIRLFEMMRASNFTPDSLVYEVLLQSLCKNLRLDDAIKVLEEMMETGLTPPNNVFVDVVNVFCKLGKVDNAMKFLEDKKIMETSACNVLLEGLCSVGKFLVAEDLLVEMSERNVASCNSWNIVIRWLSKNGRIWEVMELLVLFTFTRVHGSLLHIQTLYHSKKAGGVETSSGRDMFEEPLPSIECLEISGKAFPGQELVVCRYGVNGTTPCFFDLGCYVDDGSVSYIDGEKSPKYIVSAADVDTYLGVEVQPMLMTTRVDYVHIRRQDPPTKAPTTPPPPMPLIPKGWHVYEPKAVSGTDAQLRPVLL